MMNTSLPNLTLRHCLFAAWGLLACGSSQAGPIIPDVPLFTTSSVKPNVLIILDNSESMDGTMPGKVVSGDDPTTRGNIARTVLKSLISTYQTQFNWGLESFKIDSGSPSLYNIHAYYFGDSNTMKFTSDCVSGYSASNVYPGGYVSTITGLSLTGTPLRCVAHNDPAAVLAGTPYITYDRAGDDPDVNDVLYSSWTQTFLWGRGTTGTSYNIYQARATAPVGNTWLAGDFSSFYTSAAFTATDAGFLPTVASYPRQIWIRRPGYGSTWAWGYGNGISGYGIINEPVKDSGVAGHLATLNTLLGSETKTATGEIKNFASYTPIDGSLQTAKTYFAGASSPITNGCQKNFVILATDGNPTGKTNGTQYSPSAWANATTGQAYLDAYASITALRTTIKGGSTYDIKTYVVGMGDTVANPVSIAGLNQMANLGGGNGTAYVGSSSAALTTAFASIAANIIAQTGAASSVAVNGGSYTTNSDLYQATFTSLDWIGHLYSYGFHPVWVDINGNTVVDAGETFGVVNTTFTWDAAETLANANWNTGRKIITYKPSAVLGNRGIPFRWPAIPATPTATELDTTQVSALNTSPTAVTDTYGSIRLQYLRGDNTQECVGCTPQFRARTKNSSNNTYKLGDIVDSSPQYVGAPIAGYSDSMESVTYRSFRTANANRSPVLYVGANDGMLHAFDASTSSTGAELFAYVPNSLYSKLTKLTDTAYAHTYFVNGSPTINDVFYAGAWHSLLVSGMRSGGRGVFALDVTNPTAFTGSTTETSAASNVVRWEFTDADDSDMGFVYGQASLVKANNGQWVVLVPNGYNSTSDKAFLFVINAQTGALIQKIATSSATGNGLSAISAIDTNGDQIVDYVYGTDLQGNVWKFDLTSSTPSSWAVAYSGSPLFSAGSAKPITTQPKVTKHPNGGYLVLFGTGQYLTTADITTTTTQTMYGIWDNNATVASSNLQQQTWISNATVSSNDFRLTSHAVGMPTDATLSQDNLITYANYYSSKKGWYFNLPDSGERDAKDIIIRSGRVILTSTIPTSSASTCTSGGTGWITEFDVFTGNRLDDGVFDTNNDGIINSLDKISSFVYSGAKVSSGLPSSPTIITQPCPPGSTNCTETKLTNTSGASLQPNTEKTPSFSNARVFWQQIK